MYAVAYETHAGFASVGFLRHAGAQIDIADPVLGNVLVSPDECFSLIDTETGSCLTGVSPVEEGAILLAAEVGVEEPHVSGYPLAWDRIKHWRLDVAPDWRSVALAAIFARTTIRRTIEEAEDLYRIFGPTLRAMIMESHIPAAEEMALIPGIAGTRAARFGDLESYIAILEWAPWCAEQLYVSDVYDRTFRDFLALAYTPRLLGMAKLSFSMMLLGRDAACIDSRMWGYFYKRQDDIDRLVRHTSKRSEAAGALGFNEGSIRAYRYEEDKLVNTPFFDPDWFMPYARAQWMLWETLGPTATPTEHAGFWEVMDPLIDEIRTALTVVR